MDAMSPFHCPHKALSHEFMSSLGTADQSKQAERCRGARLCAPTPPAHTVGGGLGVRANTHPRS
jgi:hypothetical protein